MKAVFDKLIIVSNLTSAFALFVLMFLTVVDVFIRYFFDISLSGVLELTEYLMVPIVYLPLAWCAKQNRHVKVEIFVSKLKPHVQQLLIGLTLFLSLAVALLLTWEGFSEAIQVWETRKVSDILKIPAYPFRMLLSIGCLLLSLVLAAQLIQVLIPLKRNGS